jgi:hypothetical protein
MLRDASPCFAMLRHKANSLSAELAEDIDEVDEREREQSEPMAVSNAAPAALLMGDMQV